ncbi:MAG TPA: polyhydroxyalkanoate synthesis regulator DNA-binding domain-containing protein [Myxococcota bacterium]|nr:polyhydroxyalkanoate synthesis regulator DNA-binding domain-containing protein [Myxococcota bacterium]HQK49695.1 polyhydroxyalkanoate synthesis regulator DNA-binding domain-containing protein [Myxococcota bacterium]
MKTIRRYPNRKLYDTEASRYITLEEIGAFLKAGGEVRVVDSKTGEDITGVTIAQVLVGEEKRTRSPFQGYRLATLLQSSGEYLKEKLAPVATIREEAERTVQRLIQSETEEVREFLTGTSRAIEDFQRRADDRFQTMLAAIRSFAPLRRDVEDLQRRVAELERRCPGAAVESEDPARESLAARRTPARRRGRKTP